MVTRLILSLLLPCATMAQDPASGWMAYAVGKMPEKYERITKLTMTWKVGEAASPSRAFYSPWFGMDPSDNLNLIQPVNPWGGSSWSMYTEYYQWSPTHNSNSRSYSVEAGQTLRGSLEYDNATDSYTLSQTILETGKVSSQVVECQSGKKYVLPYVVYEKTFPCADYPPDEEVLFYDISAECDGGADCTDELVWETAVKDANCDMAAHVLSSTSISITWNTSAASRYDGVPYDEIRLLNSQHGWAKALREAGRL